MDSRVRKAIFERQAWHLAALAPLLAGVAWAHGMEGVQTGSLFGIGSGTWLWIAVACAVAHEGYAWFGWRTQLHLNLWTRTFGRRAFSIFAAGFMAVAGARILALLPLALANRGTLPGAVILWRALALAALVPALYLVWSVFRYFGWRRAVGIDHFDASYRTVPLVKQGIYRYTNHGMYLYGFLLTWAVALAFASPAALVAALFNHLYVAVQYWAIEAPDLKHIYGK
jgi:protein-S-isoprenylcysteine O-methyltransferase Ste14